MKLLQHIALCLLSAATLLCSCGKERLVGDGIAFGSDGRIRISAFVEDNKDRAGLVKTADVDSFLLFINNSSDTPISKGVLMVRSDDGSYFESAIKIPKITPGASVKLWAISPVGPECEGPKGISDLEFNKFSYKLPSDNEAMEDIIVSGPQSATADAEGGFADEPPLTFKHIFSAVGFKYSKNDGFEGKIDAIELRNVYTSMKWNGFNDPETTYSNLQNVRLDFGEGKEKTMAEDNITAYDQYFMVMPTTVDEDAKVYVSATASDGTHQNYMADLKGTTYKAGFTKTYSLELVKLIKALKFTSAKDKSKVGFANALEDIYRFYYSSDGDNWKECYGKWSTTLNAGESIYIKGDNPNGLNVTSNPFFSITGSVSCKGNIMYLLGEDITEIPANGCFRYMFSGCSGLTSAPDLPATTLTASCYYYLFQNCTSLTKAPDLPATTLASYCYQNMFSGCTSLNAVNIYAEGPDDTKWASSYLNGWLKSVSGSGTIKCKKVVEGKFVKNSSSGVPQGWSLNPTL